jgi:hypothetical protein
VSFIKIGAVKAILQGHELHFACIFYIRHLFFEKKSLQDCELCENWCSERHSLLNDVTHFCLHFPHYCVIWVNCGVRYLNITLLAFVSLMKSGTGKTVLFLWM